MLKDTNLALGEVTGSFVMQYFPTPSITAIYNEKQSCHACSGTGIIWEPINEMAAMDIAEHDEGLQIEDRL